MEYKLCLDCAAEFVLESQPHGAPMLKRRKSKSKKRYFNKFNHCPLCGGLLLDTNTAAEIEYAQRQQREMPRLEQAALARGESVAGVLNRAWGNRK